MILELLLSTYALVATIILVWRRRRRSSRDEIQAAVENWFKISPMTHESVSAFSEFTTSQQGVLPWFERSLSTVGVVAFLAMSITTAVQSIQSINSEVQAKLLRAEVSDLEKQKDSATRVINSSIRALRDVVSMHDGVDPGVKELLRFHLQRTVELKDAPKDMVLQAFGTAVLIGDYETARELFRKWPDLAAASKPEEQLALAEGLYLLGQPQRSREVMTDVMSRRSELPINAQRRTLILSSVLNPAEDQAGPFAALLGLSIDDAHRVLDAEGARLRHAPTLMTSPAKLQ
jgi:hypothetical protein